MIMKKVSKKGVKLTGLIALFAMFFVLGLNASALNVKAEGETTDCEHKHWIHRDAFDVSVEDKEAKEDGWIEHYYCPDCGKYATDQSFTNILSADEVKDYYVEDEVVIALGGDTLKADDIMETPAGLESVNFDGIDFSKYKYIASHSETGTIIKTTTNTKLYKNTLKDVEIKVVTKCADANKKTKTVKVKFELPDPKVKVKKKWNGDKCRYTFTYTIKGASKIKVRMVNGKNDKVINVKAANKVFDKYMNKAKSDKESYISIKRNFLKKYNNNINFKFTAYYGKKTVSVIVEP